MKPLRVTFVFTFSCLLTTLACDQETYSETRQRPDICTAIREHDYQRLACIIAKDPEVINRHADPSGRTPLMAAIRAGDLRAAKLLIQKGAQLEARDRNGRTALHHACAAGFKEITQLLIAEGARLNSVDRDDRSPLHHAIINYRHHYMYGRTGCAGVLLSQGADRQIRDKFGKTPLDYFEMFSERGICRTLVLEEVE